METAQRGVSAAGRLFPLKLPFGKPVEKKAPTESPFHDGSDHQDTPAAGDNPFNDA
eukprot:CAMPEP_0184252920 /NCGR_PEP_ID=MMETSP0977-20130417/6343_1 /TAXON_ID=483370 /ORGANISM="non described non described, Strain CCMP2097" /LENGTH=55 /DNA_ID=CAMNT_0026558413 /DNA_START=22 /DNA_END=185 /DNA_ORIENTATION=+